MWNSAAQVPLGHIIEDGGKELLKYVYLRVKDGGEWIKSFNNMIVPG